MKKGILLYITSIALLTVFVGCSGDSEKQTDSIIGKCTLTSRIISGVQVPIEECEELFILMINWDGTAFTRFSTSEIPEKCQTINFVLIKWEKISENRYQTSLYNLPVATFFLEGNQLLEKMADSNRINFYVRKN